MTTRLIAVEKFFYNGRNVEQGEEFDAEDSDVMILTHHHTPKATTLELEPQARKAGPKPKRAEPEKWEASPGGGYKRRDMKPED